MSVLSVILALLKLGEGSQNTRCMDYIQSLKILLNTVLKETFGYCINTDLVIFCFTLYSY